MSSFFFIVATIFVVTAGTPTNPDGDKRFFRHHFETMDECKAFLNSDEFAARRTELAGLYVSKFDADHVPKLTILAQCEEYKAKGGDEGKI